MGNLHLCEYIASVILLNYKKEPIYFIKKQNLSETWLTIDRCLQNSLRVLMDMR